MFKHTISQSQHNYYSGFGMHSNELMVTFIVDITTSDVVMISIRHYICPSDIPLYCSPFIA